MTPFDVLEAEDFQQIAEQRHVEIDPPKVLQAARDQARASGHSHAGGVSPIDAWHLKLAGAAVLVDVRTVEERKFVGEVAGAVPIAWATGTAMNRNPRFVRELEQKLKKDDVILFLCRSGKRSVLAAEAAAKAGFTNAFNILEGFEGDLDQAQQRGHRGGWRFHGLPWTQD